MKNRDRRMKYLLICHTTDMSKQEQDRLDLYNYLWLCAIVSVPVTHDSESTGTVPRPWNWHT